MRTPRPLPVHLAAVAAAALLLPGVAQAAVFVVNATFDRPDAAPGDCVCASPGPAPVCTLRAAVMESNACAVGGPPHDIVLGPGNHVLRIFGPGGAGQGDLDVQADVSVWGAGMGATRISAGPLAMSPSPDRIFDVPAGVRLSLSDLTLRRANHAADGGLLRNAGDLFADAVEMRGGTSSAGVGGALANSGVADLVECDLHHNTAYDYGGAIYNSGDLVATYASIRLNALTAASSWAAALYNAAGATAVVKASTIAYHSTATTCGAVGNWGTITLEATNVVGNYTSGNGGGVGGYGTIEILDSWVQGNRADGWGGGVAAFEDLTVSGSTIARNTCGVRGGGLYVTGASGAATIEHSSLYDNAADVNGGGIAVYKDLDISDSTLSVNKAVNGYGGALYVVSGSALSLAHATIAENKADLAGGGIYESGGSVDLTDTIVAFNTTTTGTAPDCSGGPTSGDYNIIYDTTDCGWVAAANDLTGDPDLSAWTVSGFLASSGHYPPVAGGQADGSGGDCTGIDQIGTGRTAPCDRGAVEGP